MKVSVRGALLLGAAAGVTVLGAGSPSHGWASTVMVLIPSAVILVFAIRRRPPDPPDPGPRDRRGLVLWSALVAVGLAWEAYAFVRQPDWSQASYAHPTVSTLLDPVLEHGPLRLVGWLVWLAAGWRLVSR